MNKVGIVILNYNDYKTTSEMLNNIKNYKVLDYIIVVDNKSTDGSFAKLKELEDKNIKVIKTDSNNGYATGNNCGIKYLVDNFAVDYIIISNPDISVSEESIIKLKNDLNDNKNISVIAPVVHEGNNISRGWKIPSYSSELLSNINFFHKFATKKLQYSVESYNSRLTKVEVVSGCFFMIRKSDFVLINYFDPNTFLYYEENIIGNKLKKLNKETYIDNEVDIIHNLSISVDKSIKSINKYKILKNSQEYYQSTYNNLNIFGMALLRVTYYISLIVAYLVCFVRNIGGKRK